jgi:hypothetical protein
MLACPERRFLFVHIHKNAGRSIKRYLKAAARLQGMEDPDTRSYRGAWVHGHTSLAVLRRRFPELCDWFSFASTRDPLDRLLSAYYWIDGKAPDARGLSASNLERIRSFDHFVERLYDCWRADPQRDSPRGAFHHPRAQVRLNDEEFIYPDQCAYLCNANGEMLVDALVRQEALEEDLTRLLPRLFGEADARPPQMRPAGRSSRPQELPITDPRTFERVFDMYRRDYERLDYSPEASRLRAKR